MRARGFTLIELMVVVAILAILSAVAVPSFRSAYLSNKLASYSNDFVASVQFARSEAIKRNVQTELCASSNGTSCTTSATSWQPGWIVMCPASSSTATSCTSGGSSTLVLQKHDAVSSSYGFTTTDPTSNGYDIKFPANGVGSTSYTLKLCSTDTAYNTQWREIYVIATGRSTITRHTTAASSCP